MTDVLTPPQTAEQILSECRAAGISLFLKGETLRYQAETGTLTDALRQTIRQHRTALIALLRSEQELAEAFRSARERDEPPPVPSPEGMALLEPFLPVIKAAHRGELPPYVVTMYGKETELEEYICRESAGIWYGFSLDNPRLSDRLENLRRIQAWYEGWIADTPK